MGFGFGGDIRLPQRRDWLLDRVVETGSVVMKRVGGGRAGEMAGHRFISHEAVTPHAILGDVYARTAAACAGADVLAVQDTSEVNFSGRELGRTGLGPGGDGKSAGFFIHPVLAVDAAGGAMLGLVHAHIWTRGPDKAGDRRSRPFEDKEAARWRGGMEAAAASLCGAARITVVGDRESDIYPVFAARPAGVDLLVRAAQNRSLAGGGLLFEAGEAFEPRVCALVDHVPRAPGGKPRRLNLHLSAGRVEILRPGTAGKDERPASASIWSSPRRRAAPSSGGSSPRCPSTRPKISSASLTATSCAGASRRRSGRSSAAASALRTARPRPPAACSMSPPSRSPPPCASSSSPTPETAAPGPPATSSLTKTCQPRSPSAEAWKEALKSKRTRIRKPRSPTLPGFAQGSADGTATASLPAPKQWLMDGKTS